MYDLARRLVENHDHTVHVLAPSGGAENDSRFWPGLTVERFIHPWIGPRSLRADTDIGSAISRRPLSRAEALSLSTTLIARARALAGEYDVVISNWLIPSGVAGAIARSGRTRHIAIAHGGDVHMLRQLPGGDSLGRFVARGSDRLVFVSEELKRIFVERTQSAAIRSEVIAMGAELGSPLAGPRRERSKRVVALYLGRLHPIKGVDLLFEAAETVPDLEIWVAGAGPEEGALRSRAELSKLPVSFLGEVDRMHRRKLLEDCDVVVIPSRVEQSGRTEGAPVVCSEALVAGRPVIASRTGGNAELIEPGVSGLLFAPGSAVDLSEALSRFVNDESLRLRLSEGAREAGRTKTMATTAAAFDAVMREIHAEQWSA